MFRRTFREAFGREFQPDAEDEMDDFFWNRARGQQQQQQQQQYDPFAHAAFRGGSPFGSFDSAPRDPFGGFFRQQTDRPWGSGGGPSESVSTSISWRDGKKITTRRRTVVDGSGVSTTHVTEIIEDDRDALKLE